MLLILAFGEPVNANIASSAAVIVAPELAHDYSALLGPGWGAEDSDGEDEEEDDRPRVQSRECFSFLPRWPLADPSLTRRTEILNFVDHLRATNTADD